MTAIVTWTTPYQDALRAFNAAGEALETGTREEAMALLREHLRHVRELLGFLHREERLAHGELIADFKYEQIVAAMKHRQPYPPTT